MSLTVEENTSSIPKMETGSYPGICHMLVDVGTQHSEYEGQKNVRRQIAIGFVFPGELIPEGEFKGQPRTAVKYFTASLAESANLRKALDTWRGRQFTPDELRGFDLNNIVGVPALISMGENKNGKVVIQGIAKMPKGMEIPATDMQQIVFDLDAFDETVFNSLPGFLQKSIKESDEYGQICLGGPVATDGPAPHEDDDIPF